MIRAFVSTIPNPGESVLLDRDERRHVRSARRARDGDRIELLDGAGHVAPAQLEEDVSGARVAAIEVFDPPPDIAIAVAVARGGRFDSLVEKLTELGIASIEPIVCARSLLPRGASRQERWRRVAVAALKQSRQPWVPRIAAPAPLASVIGDGRQLLALDPQGEAVPIPDAIDAPPIRLLIGPEGGFDDTERALLAASGARMVSLPSAILRVETAAMVAAVLALHALNRA